MKLLEVVLNGQEGQVTVARDEDDGAVFLVLDPAAGTDAPVPPVSIKLDPRTGGLLGDVLLTMTEYPAPSRSALNTPPLWSDPALKAAEDKALRPPLPQRIPGQSLAESRGRRPAEPVHVEVRPVQAPAGSSAELAEAIRGLSVDDGSNDSAQPGVPCTFVDGQCVTPTSGQ